jgi:hypothetical protein
MKITIEFVPELLDIIRVKLSYPKKKKNKLFFTILLTFFYENILNLRNFFISFI